MRKITVKFFSIMDYEEEAQYLSEMHKKGWKFVKVCFPGIYFFEKCEPEDVVYQLDYNQNGRREKDEYVQMFEDCGWEYITDFVGYSYFRKTAEEMNGDEMIFCDDDSRVEMINRVFKGRMIPLIVLFVLVIAPMFVFSILHNDAGEFTGFAILMGAVGVLYITILIKYIRSHRNYKERMKI